MACPAPKGLWSNARRRPVGCRRRRQRTVNLLEGGAGEIIVAVVDEGRRLDIATAAIGRRDHAVPGGDVGDVGDLRFWNERAVEAGERVHDRPGNKSVVRPGEEKHPVGAQSGRIIDGPVPRRCFRRADAALSVRRTQERSGSEVRADAERLEQALRIVVAGAEVGPSGKDRGARKAGRMGDVELVGHVAARGYARDGDGGGIDAQRRKRLARPPGQRPTS